MTADFLFSFLLFFQVQMDSIRDSGFYKLLEESYPELANAAEQAQSDPELQKFIELTGMDFDDLTSLSLTIEALEGITDAQAAGNDPRLGSEFEFLLSTELEGELDAAALFGFILQQLEKEEGEEARKQVEETKKIMRFCTSCKPKNRLRWKNAFKDYASLFGDLSFRIQTSESESWTGVKLEKICKGRILVDLREFPLQNPWRNQGKPTKNKQKQ